MNQYAKQVPLHAIKTKEMGPLGFGIIDLFGTGRKTYDTEIPHRHAFLNYYFYSGPGKSRN